MKKLKSIKMGIITLSIISLCISCVSDDSESTSDLLSELNAADKTTLEEKE